MFQHPNLDVFPVSTIDIFQTHDKTGNDLIFQWPKVKNILPYLGNPAVFLSNDVFFCRMQTAKPPPPVAYVTVF